MDYLPQAKKVFEIEIQALEATKNALGESFNHVVEMIVQSTGRVVVTGMGKSGIVGKKIAATLASTGTRSFFVHPGEAYHGDLGMIHDQDVILAISNSGETEEIIRLLAFFKSNNNQVVAISKSKDSTLAKNANYYLPLVVNREACHLELAPTSSTTTTLALGDALAVTLMKAKNFKTENFARFHPGGSLGRKLLTRAIDVARKDNLPILNLENSFEDIIDIITNGRLGMGIVVDEEKVIGIVTDGDIRRLLKDQKEKSLQMKVRDFYTKNPVIIDPDTKLHDAEELMNEKKISSLVLAKNCLLIGVLHRLDSRV